MSLPVFRTGLISLIVLALLTAALAAISTSGPAAADYNPTLDYQWCNGLPDNYPPSKVFIDFDLAGTLNCTEDNPAADTAENRTNVYVIPGIVGDPAASDGNFSFAPATLSSSDHVTAADAAIPNGTKVGGFTAGIRIGVLNGACVTPKDVDFILYDSETRNSNIVPTSPEDTPNRFLWQDFAQTTPLILDADVDLLADADSPLILQNPSFYPPMFDPDLDYPGATGAEDGPIDPIEPLARYTGATEVAGTWQVLTFFQFSPNQLAPFASDPNNAPHPFGKVGSQNYFISQSVLNDPTATKLSVSTVHDFCTPLFTRVMLLGETPTGCDVSGNPDPVEPPSGNSPYDQPCERGKTPPTDGTRAATQYSYSLRDADGDGIMNNQDTCPWDANDGSYTDTDGDGIHDDCDVNTGGPNPGNAATGNSVDDWGAGDPYWNRQDNCPQDTDDTGADGENSTTYILAAPDGGPKGDGIGDVCDGVVSNGNSAGDGNAALADGFWAQQANEAVYCVGTGNDTSPADGVCDADAPWVATLDIDGDTNVDATSDVDCPFTATSWPTPSDDMDCDGWTTARELVIGTDPTDACPESGEDAVPPDINNDKSINVIDIGEYAGFFPAPPNTYIARFDLNADGSVNVIDIGEFGGIFPTPSYC